MKRSFNSLVILATGSALLFASVGCERKQRTPANKTTGAANGEKPKDTTVGGTSGSGGSTPVGPQKKEQPKIEANLKSVEKAIADLAKLYQDSKVQPIVAIKGTKDVEKFAMIANGQSAQYELNAEALNQLMEETYANSLKGAQAAKVEKAEEAALKDAQSKATAALTAVINSMTNISSVLNAQKIEGMDETNREAEKKRLSEITEILKTAIEKDIASFKSKAETKTSTTTDEDLDDAAGADA